MHQANEALSDRIDQFATDLRQSEARSRDYLDAKLSNQMDEIRAMLVTRNSSMSSSSRRRHSSYTSSNTSSNASPPRPRSHLRDDRQDHQASPTPLHGNGLQDRLRARERQRQRQHEQEDDALRQEQLRREEQALEAQRALREATHAVNERNRRVRQQEQALRQERQDEAARNEERHEVRQRARIPRAQHQDNLRSKHMKTLLHAKSDIIIATITMKSTAMASSSSTCLSSPEAPIPKTISHGH